MVDRQKPEPAKYELPPAIAAFAGQINDTDCHEAMPVKRWADVYGSEVKPLADALLNAGNEGQAILMNPELDADDTEINAHNVWKVKMEKAPGCLRHQTPHRGDGLHRCPPPGALSRHRPDLRARALQQGGRSESVPLDHRRPQGVRLSVDGHL